MNPTTEQQRAVELFLTGGSLAIEAGAGTGKTSTLVLIAEAAGRARRGQYVAFNKALVEDSAGKFPLTVASNTAHSLAYRAMMNPERRARLSSTARVPGWELAKRLGIGPQFVTDFEGKPKALQPAFLAGHLNRAITHFCQTADEELTVRHFPYIDGLDAPTSDGRRTYSTNLQVAAELLPVALRAWDDIQRPYGQVPFKHEHYLKLWQLSGPRIEADYILFDEAQDANPVIAAIVAAQDHAQIVYVGDSQQEIYGWTGAINALGAVSVANRSYLTQSFRFGQAVADEANAILSMIEGAEIRLTGNPAIESVVESVARPAAILTRTNATGIERLLTLQKGGVKATYLGGSNDVLSFARGAMDLQLSGRTGHPELACFDSWAAVLDYVKNDVEGADLALNVNLIQKFGPDEIIFALEHMPPERYADVVISTAHRSKGRQWPSVQLGSDFRLRYVNKLGIPVTVGPEELRLLYVAITRAQQQLDIDILGGSVETGKEGTPE